MTTVRILTATYGPCIDDANLSVGHDHGAGGRLGLWPKTRNVLPFIQTLLFIAARSFDSNEDCYNYDNDSHDVTIPINVNTLTLLEAGQSMNTIFGDPCPGLTKKLSLTYIFFDTDQQQQIHCPVKSESLSCSFSEHESIILKRFRSQTKHKNFHSDERTDLNNSQPAPSSTLKSIRSHNWELILPMILPFLELHQRVESQLVCKLWRDVIQEWGYIQVVDVSNPTLMITPSFVSGILAQSYASLHSLHLARFQDLHESVLLSALPSLRKLKTLDISYCTQLGDQTLEALSLHSNQQLLVLYMKGLNRVTDHGISCIAKKCTQLRVLDISYIRLTDTSAALIGEYLLQLEALYLRDNYMLTNESIDRISKKCRWLKQLVLWGCLQLNNITVTRSCEHLVLLNLWGVLGLTDSISSSIKNLLSLRTLIVSECHKLTDAFVVNIATSVIGPQIAHLHLRFLRKITDLSVTTIAHNMTRLYSLDLSFCTKVSIDSLVYLLEERGLSLCELRLHNCSQIDLTVPSAVENGHDIVVDMMKMSCVGRRLYEAIHLCGDNGTLCLLDLRGCVGIHPSHKMRVQDEIFVQGMITMGYNQPLIGFFEKPIEWTKDMKEQVYAYLIKGNYMQS